MKIQFSDEQIFKIKDLYTGIISHCYVSELLNHFDQQHEEIHPIYSLFLKSYRLKCLKGDVRTQRMFSAVRPHSEKEIANFEYQLE